MTESKKSSQQQQTEVSLKEPARKEKGLDFDSNVYICLFQLADVSVQVLLTGSSAEEQSGREGL